MAIENNDLLVLQKNGGGELRKATVAALLAGVAPPTVPEVIGDLNDVDTTTTPPVDGQVLKWTTDKWVPANDEVKDLENYLQKPGSDGSFIIVENAGTITYETFESQTIDGGEYAT